ncbi:MAG: hypothetical protein ACKN9T_06935 [Candidatus Methylumidiphilus sp.]
MLNLPREATELYPEYVDYVATLPGDLVVGDVVLFQAPKDPGCALGRCGDENFQRSVLIGHTKEFLIILKYDIYRRNGPYEWRYCVTTCAEWDVLEEYLSINALVDAIKAGRLA